MVSNLSYNVQNDQFWQLCHLGITFFGSMSCILVLGLKFKWFRAQLKLNETPKSRIESPVQGVGFKMKNLDDYPIYRITSEFAQPHRVQNKAPNASINKNQISNPILQSSTEKSVNMSNKSPIPISTSINSPKTIKNERKINENITKPQSILKKLNYEENSEEFIEITNPSAQKYSELIKKPLKQQEEQYYFEKQITNFSKPTTMQIKNPLATQNMTMPPQNENNSKIKIVDEKPKAQQEKDEQKVDELHFTAMNSNMYSSQAASIFFGAKAPVPEPRPRKFVEMDEDDNISFKSQTSA